jgi:hypothetical protein
MRTFTALCVLFCVLGITPQLLSQSVENITPVNTQAQNVDVKSNFMSDWQFLLLKTFKRTNWFFTGSASILGTPSGIADIPLSQEDSSPLVQVGFGWKTWLGNITFSQDIQLGTWQIQTIQDARNKIAHARFVNFGLGYTVFEQTGFRLSPTVIGGFGHSMYKRTAIITCITTWAVKLMLPTHFLLLPSKCFLSAFSATS